MLVKKYKLFTRCLLLTLTLSIVLSSVVSCFTFENDMEDFFAQYETFADSSIAIWHNGHYTLYYDGVEYEDIPVRIIEGGAYQLHRTWAIVCDGILYAILNSDTRPIEGCGYIREYEICKYDLATGTTEMFDFANSSPDGSPGFIVPWGYYRDRYLVMSDGINANKFNIDTYEVETVPVDEFPDNPQWCYPRQNDDGNLVITADNKQIEISIDFLAQRNELAKALSELDDFYLGFLRIDPLKVFFKNEMSNIYHNGKYYFICNVFDKTDDSISVVFSYDVDKDELRYLCNVFAVEYYETDIIPVIEPLNNDN